MLKSLKFLVVSALGLNAVPALAQQAPPPVQQQTSQVAPQPAPVKQGLSSDGKIRPWFSLTFLVHS
jgi:hypothetical protein